MGAGGISPNWTALYPANTKIHPDRDFDSVLGAFRNAACHNPESVALFYFDRSISFGELDRDSDAVAAWLQDHQIGKGDRVSIVTQNLPAFPLMCLAAWKVGAVPVPGNPMYRHVELARILEDAAPSAILCETSVVDEVHRALEITSLGQIPVLTCRQGRGDDSIAGHPMEIDEIVRRYDGRAPDSVAVAPGDLGLILYTSGTTGVPKGAMLTHRALLTNAQFLQGWCELDGDSRILAIAPFFHITGLVCHICVSFVVGCANIINYRFDPQTALEMIRKWRPTFTIGAITAFNALSSVPGATRDDMACFKSVFSGGAPIPPALKSDIEAKLGFTIYPCYGMTETAAPAVFTPLGVDAPVHDGQLAIGIPIPGLDLRVVDDSGKIVPVGEPGEIVMCGPQVMEGYWRKPGESAEALEAGWLHSGDVGLIDEQGWVYLVDRKKDVIIASGFKVWPREVEDVLYGHPAVREAAVIGVPDSYRGESVKACISLRPSAHVDEAEIVAHCRANLAGYKVPRIVEIMDDLPKTVSGKIQRVALKPA